jgi:hypothetical protein
MAMVKMVWLCCERCGVSFEKLAAEIKRQQRKSPTRKFYCSISCHAQHKGKYSLGTYLGVSTFQPPGRLINEFSAFRYFMRKARERKHEQETNLTLNYLKNLWEAQGGRCAISGRQMELPICGQAWEQMGHDPWKPSLDRIDSSQGYLIGNVRFVTMIANFAKHEFSDELLFDFCKAVVEYQKAKETPETTAPTPYTIQNKPSKAKEQRSSWCAPLRLVA